jgi:hypothetical protein
MVGTAVYHVGLNSSSHAKNCGAEKSGGHTTLAPAVIDTSTGPMRPCM